MKPEQNNHKKEFENTNYVININNNNISPINKKTANTPLDSQNSHSNNDNVHLLSPHENNEGIKLKNFDFLKKRR